MHPRRRALSVTKRLEMSVLKSCIVCGAMTASMAIRAQDSLKRLSSSLSNLAASRSEDARSRGRK